MPSRNSPLSNPGAMMRLIVTVKPLTVNGKRLDSLELECGHVLTSQHPGKQKSGHRTRCPQCRPESLYAP